MSIFSFQNLGHAFASALHDIHVGLAWAAQETAKIQAAAPSVLSATTPAIQALFPQYAPTITEIERAAFSLLGTVTAVIHTSDATANGVTVSLDAATVTAIKDLITQYKPQLAAVGITV